VANSLSPPWKGLPKVMLANPVLTAPVDRGLSVAQNLLEVRDLSVSVSGRSSGETALLKAISFHIANGEIVGLLGESGAGKSTLAMALLRLLPPAFRITGGSIQFEASELLSLSPRELRKTRGARISIIAQESTVLNPVMRVGDQIAEVLRAHRDWNKRLCRDEAKALLKEVEIEDVDRVYMSYPHQLSGGQRQRVVIAQALACRPALVIADEPTASLDPATAASIVDLLKRLNRQWKIAFLMISHDIRVLAQLADRVMVIYAGRIIEQGSSHAVLHNPLHPYTQALLGCALPEEMTSDPPIGKSLLPSIAGMSTEQSRSSIHCGFESRCAVRMRICAIELPKEFEAASAHRVSCFKFGNS
jgi:peptide/nickel transport system ATP-binding protein